MANPISNLGTIPTFNFMGFTITDITNLKALHGYGDGTNRHNTLRESGASSGYLVPALKTFRVIGVMVWQDAASRTTIGYANADVGQAVTTAFTSPIYQTTGTATPQGTIGNLAANTVANPFYSIPTKFDVPTGKYVVSDFNTAGNCSVTVFGYEI